MNTKSLMFTLVFTCFVSTFAKAEDRQIAQCILTNNVLSALATVHTARGNEFFKWNIPSVTASNLIGSHDGSEIMNLFSQVTLPKTFKATVSESSVAGEVYIDIKDADLSELSPIKDFSFKCNVISY